MPINPAATINSGSGIFFVNMRVTNITKAISTELVDYKNQVLPFMPGRRTVDKRTCFLRDFFNHDRGN